MANKDNPSIGKHFENTIWDYYKTQGIELNNQFGIPIGFPGKKRVHNFDLGATNPAMIIECKAHTWTEGGNVPCAKLSVWRQSMFYFSLTTKGYQKIFFVLKSIRNGETLADYFIAKCAHLIPPDVEIWEYDVEEAMAVRKYYT